MPLWMWIALGAGAYFLLKGSSKTNINNLTAAEIETHAKTIEDIFKTAGLTHFTVGADKTYGFCLYDSRLASATVTSTAAVCSTDWYTYLNKVAAYIAAGATKLSTETYSSKLLASQFTDLIPPA